MKMKLILLIPMLLVLVGLFGCRDNNSASGVESATGSSAQAEADFSSAENMEAKTSEFVLPEIAPVSYTTLTSGSYTYDHYSNAPLDHFEVGSVIEAYPLDFAYAFDRTEVEGSFRKSHYIGEKYDYEWVCFSGYILNEENGYTNLRASMDTEGTPKVILQDVVESVGLWESDNIRPENGWTAEHGDFITVVGQYGGHVDNEYGHFIRLYYVFLVEET